MDRGLPVLGAGGSGEALGSAAGAVGSAGAPGMAKDTEPDDPMELVAVPVAVDTATFDEMARCLVEEYVRDGWPDERLLELFRSPFYAGLHVIWRTRGERWVRDEIGVARARWRRPDPAAFTSPQPEGAV